MNKKVKREIDIKKDGQIFKIPICLQNAREIKAWVDANEGKKKLSLYTNDLVEKSLWNALKYIRYNIINPYLSLPSEEQKEDYTKKNPEITEILEIYNYVNDKINDNYISPYLERAREIKKWFHETKGKKHLSISSKVPRERELAQYLRGNKENRINPNLDLEEQEEREKYRKKYPEIDEILEIVKYIDETNISEYLIRARDIKSFIDEKDGTIFAMKNDKNSKESYVLAELRKLRKYRVIPYSVLKTEKEKEDFRKKFPDTEEIVQIVEYVEKKIKILNLKGLIEKDFEKREKYESVTELERRFELLLEKEKAKRNKNAEKAGVGLDGK